MAAAEARLARASELVKEAEERAAHAAANAVAYQDLSQTQVRPHVPCGCVCVCVYGGGRQQGLGRVSGEGSRRRSRQGRWGWGSQ